MNKAKTKLMAFGRKEQFKQIAEKHGLKTTNSFTHLGIIIDRNNNPGVNWDNKIRKIENLRNMVSALRPLLPRQRNSDIL